jgi:hypothetical protein
MSNRVQAKSKQEHTSVFHSGLIKMLVMEELRNKNTNWETFLTSSHFQLDVSPTPQSKIKIPTPIERTVISEASKRKRGTMTNKDDKVTNEVGSRGPSQPSYREASPMEDHIPMDIPSSKPRVLKWKILFFFPPFVADKVKPRRHFTRATTRKTFLVKGDAAETSAQRKGKYKSSEQSIEVIDIITPQHERNLTFKRLKRQLKEERVEDDKLKEDLDSRNNLKGVLGIYHETIDKARFLDKIFFPLHKQLKNIFRQNRSHQAQIKKLKVELYPFKEELAKIILDMLAMVSTRRSSRIKRLMQ